jgi:hypothetical protein
MMTQLATAIRRSKATASLFMARHLSPGRHIARERYESVSDSAIISGGGVSVNGGPPLRPFATLRVTDAPPSF